MNRSSGTLLSAIMGFSTGIVLGLLISPKSGKENREWISKQTGEAKHWVEDHSNKLVKESEAKLNRIAKEVKETIPDLYEATSSISFEEEADESG